MNSFLSSLAARTGYARALLESLPAGELQRLHLAYPKGSKPAFFAGPPIEGKRPRQTAVTDDEIRDHVPSGANIVLTKALIQRCRSNGAFTRAAIEALGVTLPPKKGWVDALIGSTMPREQLLNAMRARAFYAGD